LGKKDEPRGQPSELGSDPSIQEMRKGILPSTGEVSNETFSSGRAVGSLFNVPHGTIQLARVKETTSLRSNRKQRQHRFRLR
jgi:hypothetical protein